jgi:uncharacterized membrane protein
MYDVPVEFVVAIFGDEIGGENALQNFYGKENEKQLGVKELALLHKDAAGKLHINEPHDPGFSTGAKIGGVVGALLGIVTGPGVVVASAAGALVGGLAGKLHDTGFDNKDLKALAEALTPNTSALLLVVDGTKLGEVNQILRTGNARLITDALRPRVAEELQAEYAAFIDKLKERGIDGLTANDWTSVSDQFASNQLSNANADHFGTDYIDSLVENKA